MKREKPSSLDRRTFIQLGGVTLAFGALSAALGRKLFQWQRANLDTLKEIDLDHAQQRICSFTENPSKHRELPKGCLIPEDERHGTMMIGITPHLLQNGKLDFLKAFDEELESVFSNLPAGTSLQLVIPEGRSDFYRTEIKKRYCWKKFPLEIFEIPEAPIGTLFIRDNIFTTGTSDQEGRMLLVCDTTDCQQFELTMQAVKDPSKSALTHNLILGRAIHGSAAFVDEILAQRYSERFVPYHIPVSCTGGDLEITRMPDGSIGLLVGRHNVLFTIGAHAYKAGKKGKLGDLVRSLLKHDFESIAEWVKSLYAQYFNVERVVLIDEERMFSHFDLDFEAMLALENDFYHLDMAAKTMTTPKGKAIAFCTEYEARTILRKYPRFSRDMLMGSHEAPIGTIESSEYLKRIAIQYRALGYEVETLPCGPAPSMNYANAVAFTRNGGEKCVIVPQYGLPDEDAQAVVQYRKHGFSVIPAHNSYIAGHPERYREGSLHCQILVTA